MTAPDVSASIRGAARDSDAQSITRWPAYDWTEKPLRIEPPSRRSRWTMRALIIVAVAMLAGFLAWLLQPSHIGDLYLFIPLTAALGLTALGWLFEWWYYWRIEAPKPCTPGRVYTVDIFTTACPGEPREMILRTLLAMQRISYPHTSYLCDEGDDPQLKDICEQLGVIHIARAESFDAKAGNINNALRLSSGEICIILDPDHEPAPFMVDRLVGYFDDPAIGFAQSVQAYRNQHTSLIARGAAEMSYHFYGPIQMGMHGAGTPQAIGANCAFRREALESIGGHAAGLAEDMHTAMRLYAKGWQGVYVPEALTRGLVPQTLGAIYKQQLKWSCGVLDLFFKVFPRVSRSMTWKQRFHFALCPTFFLRGWITAAAIFVPILCLMFGDVAWKITIGEFLLWALPLLAMAILIRMQAQHYLLEPSERGLHLIGGLLANGTWWVFMIGNLCALLHRKVPYLPTPKEDQREDAWWLATPNLVVAGVSLAVIPYGLQRDYSPFSLLMAAFAAWNAASLFFIAMLGQQRTTWRIFLSAKRMSRSFRRVLQRSTHSLDALYGPYHHVLRLGRRHPVSITVAILIMVGGIHGIASRANDRSYTMAWAHLVREHKENGGFYRGLYLPRELDELHTLHGAVQDAQRQLGTPMDITSLYLAWGPQSLERFPETTLRQTQEAGGIPMITWEPWSSPFKWAHEQDLPLANDQGVLKAIAEGTFDYYIQAVADKLGSLQGPVFLRFAHEMDNPQYPWSSAGGNTPGDFIAAWRHVVSVFHQRGASNVVFVYNPWRGNATDLYYPGDDYVDWIGITLLNYGRAGRDGKWHSFDTLYQEFDPHLKRYDKPVMLAEFGTTPYGGDQSAWLSDAFASIKTKYPQIKATILFHSDRDKNWATAWRPDDQAVGIDWSVLQHPEAAMALRNGWTELGPNQRRAAIGSSMSRPSNDVETRTSVGATQLTGDAGSFQFNVDGEPFYIKGVAYNPGHDWRDGGQVLTRRHLEKDFTRIKAMGANTIRRYAGGWADQNLFNVAEEHDLKIVYGLWLRQDIDYIKDQDLLDTLERRFVRLAESRKDEPALLAWVIGNEAWGMFQHSYEQPYLTDMRKAYVCFVERLARRIRDIDPDRPILVACESSEELAGALSDYVRYAPTVDAIGVNVYYENHLENLPELMEQFAPRKPYLVSEFGPVGYWHPSYTPRTPVGTLAEPAAHEKARMYTDRWSQHIAPNRGNNLGGIAYCWSDRYEGSATWFGLTDSKGRAKPAYFALREVWADGDRVRAPIIDELLVSDYIARPGDEIRIKITVAAPQLDGVLSAEWLVLDADYREVSTRSEPYSSVNPAVLQMPWREGICWIHLTVSDSEGRLDQRSVPIVVTSDPDRTVTTELQSSTEDVVLSMIITKHLARSSLANQ
jgi:cellulose synthase (UDP-forming)